MTSRGVVIAPVMAPAKAPISAFSGSFSSLFAWRGKGNVIGTKNCQKS